MRAQTMSGKGSKKSQKRANSTKWALSQRAIASFMGDFERELGFSTCSRGSLGPESIDACVSSDPARFAPEYLRAEMYSKFDDALSSTVKTEEALRRFRLAEDHCFLTNARLLQNWNSKDVFRPKSVRGILHAASWKIQNLLGEFRWERCVRYFGHGPGATAKLPKRFGHPGYKYSGIPDTTMGNASTARAAISLNTLWFESSGLAGGGDLVISQGNRIITVPKNFKTDRSIAIEPLMNMYVQEGIGGVIRSLLRKVGVDLNDQSKNQVLAREGSEFGKLATIDLSMASDTVSYELVRLLLPPDWFAALDSCRSSVGVLPSGEIVTYQKFSSMGNGYTFELESLIFWALLQSTLDAQRAEERRFAVYGDDLILDTASVPLFLDVLSYAGFTPNDKKTWSEGPFRESCGKHYILGDDVSPFYVKRSVKALTDLFLLHNNIYRWCGRVSTYMDVDGIMSMLSRLRGFAPSGWRKQRIPDGFGDGAFIGSFDEVQPRRWPSRGVNPKECYGLDGWRVKHLAQVPELDVSVPIGYLIYAIGAARGDPFHGYGYELNQLVLQEHVGGIPLTPRYREVTTLVRQFPSA